MPCERCGQPGYAAGAELLCATHGGVPDADEVRALVDAGGPSPLWQVATAGFVLLGVAQVGLQAVNIWALRRADAAHLGLLPGAEDTLRAATEAGLMARDGLWACLILFLLWFLMIGVVADRLGFDRRAVLRHWTILVGRVALVPTLVFAALSGRPDGADWETGNAIAASCAHILTTGLLVAYAVIVWRRLRPAPLPDLV
ncbi:hypothetical protein ACFO1B_35325 [Dactylosporangium siamense]